MTRCLIVSGLIAIVGSLGSGPCTAQDAPWQPSDKAMLAVDPGMHVGTISRGDAAPAAGLIVTGSEDKTVRVWSAANGAPRSTIPLPRGSGNIGKVFAVAISADGSTIAAGGWTGAEGGPRSVFLFDPDGAFVHRIDGFPGNILGLAFSPDGGRLAVTLSGGHGLRVHSRPNAWREIARDADYSHDSFGVAFATDGRLATTSLSGNLRLYDTTGSKIAQFATGGDLPFDVVFSPDGETLAVGFVAQPKVVLYDAQALVVRPGPDTSNLVGGGLSAVAWSADGGTLYAAGSYRQEGSRVVLAWSDAGRGARRSIRARSDTVKTLRSLPSGDLLIIGGDPWIARLAPDGRLWAKGPQQIDARSQHRYFSVSDDGMLVDFAIEREATRRMRFDVAALSLGALDDPDGRTQGPSRDGLDLDAILGGALDDLQRGERVLSVATGPTGDRFVVGADWHLRGFTRDDVLLWRRAAPSGVWQSTITGDGRLVVALYGDGTIRWHRLEDGVELLALFPFAGGADWVVWTPDGYFDASPGAREHLVWQVNRGLDAAAEAIPVTTFPHMARSDIVRRAVPELGTEPPVPAEEAATIRQHLEEALGDDVSVGSRLYVLSIGISDYGPEAPELALDFASQDAIDLTEVLRTGQSNRYEVVLSRLIDAEANEVAIRSGLRSIAKKMNDGDLADVAVIHFSGHGMTAGGMFYLVPYGADANDMISLEATSLDADTLAFELQQLAVRGQVIVLIDACRSGAGRLAPEADRLRENMRSPNISLFLSSSAGQDSLEIGQLQNGAFTEAVLDALKGKADIDNDQQIDVLEIAKHVATRVPELTGNRQVPTADPRSPGPVLEAPL